MTKIDKPTALFPAWVRHLTLQQQAVLALALRGPDGFPKFHPSKHILQYLRASIIKAAHLGRMLQPGEHIGSMMTLRGFDSPVFAGGEMSWSIALREFKQVEDELPIHYYTHIMHAAQVLGYKHPLELFRQRWFSFYLSCCDYHHVPPEQEEDMDARLSDFGRDQLEILD
jgi:hypothetical protein